MEARQRDGVKAIEPLLAGICPIGFPANSKKGYTRRTFPAKPLLAS